MVLLSLKKMELSVYEYNNSLFAAPKAHGSLFGYSNEALRRELGPVSYTHLAGALAAPCTCNPL